jgi:hypothetical protein
MDLFKTLIFGGGLFGSIYFGCNFLIWLAWKLNPTHFKREPNDILSYNIVGFASLLCWMVLYYLNT